jgi:hypothetical protein
VSRTGSRVSDEPLVSVAAGGGSTTAGGRGAVPVPGPRGDVGKGAAVGAGTGLPAPRMGGGGGPSDGWAPGLGAADGVAATLDEASGELAGGAPFRGEGFGDSVKDDSARSGEYATAHAIALLQHYKEISHSG